ncbi:MAG: DNA replication/repair protein RecF [Steroidobacteraceae bacterium]
MLASFRAEHLRSIATAELELGGGLNLIVGRNGAGKTSLLEAVYLLGRGRSFRTRSSERLISHGEPLARIVGQTHGLQIPQVIGIEVTREGRTVARIGGRTPDSLAELATAFPVQIIDPDIHKLVEEGSARRRRWLDWGVFHVEPSFGREWTRYQRALKQRNAALKQGHSAVELWDTELAKAGMAITAARVRVVDAIAPRWTDLCRRLAGLDLSLQLYAGWDTDRDLAEALATHATRDRERGMTGLGPHRADLRLRQRGRLAREVLSRGQQKLAAVALTLAQLHWLKADLGLRPTLLLDDPAAELDTDRLGRFIAEVKALGTQLIVTSLDAQATPLGVPEALFHVEQGSVEKV